MLCQAHQPNHSESADSAYRAYEIGDDGKIRTAVDIVASSDADAVVQLDKMASNRQWELWDRSRIVARMPPTGR